RAFGPRPLGWIHPAQAPPGKPTTYCWHVMPFAPDLGGQDDEDFKREFAEKIIATFARAIARTSRAQHHRAIRLYRQGIHPRTDQYAGRRYFHGPVQRRAG